MNRRQTVGRHHRSRFRPPTRVIVVIGIVVILLGLVVALAAMVAPRPDASSGPGTERGALIEDIGRRAHENG